MCQEVLIISGMDALALHHNSSFGGKNYSGSSLVNCRKLFWPGLVNFTIGK